MDEGLQSQYMNQRLVYSFFFLFNYIPSLYYSMEKDILKCKIHANEPITNYCTQVNCYVQLCAACICDHTQAHNLINTKPKYEHIKNTYQQTNDRLGRLKEVVFHQKNRVASIMDKIGKLNTQCYNFLKQARQDAILTVNKAFDELESNFNNLIQQEKKRSGLLNEDRLNQLFSELNQQNLQVYNITQQLNSFKNPNIIRIVNNQFLPQAQNNIRHISQELAINDQFQPNISYRPSKLSEVSMAAKKLISTAVTFPVSNNEYYRNKSISRPKQTQIKPLGLTNLGRQASIRKSKAVLDLKSPKNYSNENQKLVSTAKQNYYTKSQQESTKIFSKTHY